MSRRERDFYPTPAWATEILVDRIKIEGRVIEPCSGRGHIANVLKASAYRTVYTNDFDGRLEADAHVDATDAEIWGYSWDFDWVVSNPPFEHANKIVPLAFAHAQKGVAMLLRLSWLEPTEARGRWLEQCPPHHLLVLPRISFDGSGKTDSVTCAWFVWMKNRAPDISQHIAIVPKRAPQPRLELTDGAAMTTQTERLPPVIKECVT